MTGSLAHRRAADLQADTSAAGTICVATTTSGTKSARRCSIRPCSRVKAHFNSASRNNATLAAGALAPVRRHGPVRSGVQQQVRRVRAQRPIEQAGRRQQSVTGLADRQLDQFDDRGGRWNVVLDHATPGAFVELVQPRIEFRIVQHEFQVFVLDDRRNARIHQRPEIELLYVGINGHRPDGGLDRRSRPQMAAPQTRREQQNARAATTRCGFLDRGTMRRPGIRASACRDSLHAPILGATRCFAWAGVGVLAVRQRLRSVAAFTLGSALDRTSQTSGNTASVAHASM